MRQTARPTPAAYSTTQIALHWAILALIVVQLISHEAMQAFWDRVEDGAAAGLPGDALSLLHAGSGAAILVLVILRLVLRGLFGAPPVPDAGPVLKALAQANHIALYGLLILLPITGAAAVLAGAERPAAAHNVLVTLLWVLVGLHVAAVVYHTFVRRDGLIWRMLVPR